MGHCLVRQPPHACCPTELTPHQAAATKRDPTRTCAAGAALRHPKHPHRGRRRAAPTRPCAGWHAAAAGSSRAAPQRCWGLPRPWQILCIKEVQPSGVPILNDHEGLGEGGAGMTLVGGGARARGVTTTACG
jgi:hypothetical protein